MVANGLSDGVGSARETRQRITLNFVDHAATAAMEKLDRQTGRPIEIPLTLVGKRRQLVLELDGGTGELLKFKTGAPFVGVTPASRLRE